MIDIKKRAFSLLLAVLMCLFMVACSKSENAYPLEIYFLDVGQGDAILLRTEAGDILIDAGSESEQDALCYRLSELGVKSLKLAIFTHSDEDHIGGADGVLRRISTETVWITRYFETTEATRQLLDAAFDTNARVVSVEAGESMTLGNVSLFAFAPLDGVSESGSNDRSIVLKVTCGAVNALFMGDVSQKTEQLLLEHYPKTQFSCQLLKVAHHGSESSSSEEMLSAMSPQYAVISCGASNFFGHPHGETLARLEAVGAEILRTDLLGEIVFYTDGVSWIKK